MENLDSPEFEKLDLDEELKDWLRSSIGLSSLTSHWQSALYSFFRQGFFETRGTGLKDGDRGSRSAYKGLKTGSYLIGMDLERCSQVTRETKDISYGGFCVPETGEYIDGVEDTIETTYSDDQWRIVFYISCRFSSDTEDHFNAFSSEQKDALAENLWRFVSKEKVICESSCLTGFDLEDIFERSRLWIWDLPDRGVDHASASFRAEIKVVRDSERHRRICGLNFNELVNLINQTRPTMVPVYGSNLLRPAGVFKGLGKSHWEEKLATYLLGEGFIVSMEPDIFFPSPEVPGCRVPDLIVIQQGRCIAIEIDDRSHLVVPQGATGIGKVKAGQANVDKWKRDRDLDRLFLCNGIPVLRVWFDEVSDKPEEVLTKVLQVFNSLGGGRMLYR